MPTHEEEPAWPSDDSDDAAEAAAPQRVSLPEQQTVWVPRPKAAEAEAEGAEPPEDDEGGDGEAEEAPEAAEEAPEAAEEEPERSDDAGETAAFETVPPQEEAEQSGDAGETAARSGDAGETAAFQTVPPQEEPERGQQSEDTSQTTVFQRLPKDDDSQATLFQLRSESRESKGGDSQATAFQPRPESREPESDDSQATAFQPRPESRESEGGDSEATLFQPRAESREPESDGSQATAFQPRPESRESQSDGSQATVFQPRPESSERSESGAGEQVTEPRRLPEPPASRPPAADDTQVMRAVSPQDQRPPDEQDEQRQPWAQRPAPPQRPIPPAGSGHAQPMRIEPTGEVRPAQAVQPAEQPPAEEPPRRGRRRGLLIGAVVLVLVIAVGVALALPPVSNRLGLPWAPNFPKGDEPEPAAVTLALHAPSTDAPTPTSSGVSGQLAGPASSGALGTLAGIVVDPASGQTLWNHNPGQLLTPASATKLLTTAAALLTLDHGMQLTTKVVQGSSPDTAILVAGGDPTLSSLPDGQESIYPGAAHLDDLVAQVKQASGGRIKKVQIDLSLYSGSHTGPGWAPEDTPSNYAVEIVPGMLDAGRSNPKVDEVSRTADPAGDLLRTFASRLGASAAGNATAPKDAKVLGEVKSAPLTELVDRALQISDNVLAEAIGRQTAIASGAAASFAGTGQTTLNVLSHNGFDVTGAVVNDGSGLSPANKVSPRLLAQLLTVAAAPDDKDPRTAKLRPLLEGLPVAGGSGTLESRYQDAASSPGKGWVRAKTGTLSGVSTLAGLVLDADGRVLVFALMSNGSNITAARPALDAVAAALRGCGCR
ncbi:D-alanyl-D-alanine carboxypeptidase/D-alanyl-D-alanine endopeptidase [Amycolatopsis dongchuanensis]|uniref:D-alanyl-D-alanine carboxypeptidase/D-alanyl-D-alanine-endopeptidase n=1 Tax=Amycolatopsis dongchuanensis TaxID=1070866 RepID=A0ABP9QNC3_9PSEU